MPFAERKRGERRSERVHSVLLSALSVLSVVWLAGCVDFEPARVPPSLLGEASGTGWALNATASDAAPREASGGLTAIQTLVYEDRGAAGGYPATLQVTSFRAGETPTRADLSTRLRDTVEQSSTARGIRLGADSQEAERQVASGERSLLFVLGGTATRGSELFSADSEVRILGEVWNCEGARRSVIVVGQAQVNHARRVGGLLTFTEPDATNWRDIIADPPGTIEGARGDRGLAYNVDCTP
ncbi:MAG: hypothetical protein ACT4PT_09265 [Methanobacteriota archaeon]